MLAVLFKPQDGGQLLFGWSALSIGPASHADLINGAVRFSDYIMEGFVAYAVHVEDAKPGCRITATGEGSNRDWSIRPQVRKFITATKAKIVSEDGAATDPKPFQLV